MTMVYGTLRVSALWSTACRELETPKKIHKITTFQLHSAAHFKLISDESKDGSSTHQSSREPEQGFSLPLHEDWTRSTFQIAYSFVWHSDIAVLPQF